MAVAPTDSIDKKLAKLYAQKTTVNLDSKSTLSPEDLSLVMLKYQENYSNDDLANYFNLTTDEINQKEMEILSSLKKNEMVKLMRKTK